jgi:hypothetical protein
MNKIRYVFDQCDVIVVLQYRSLSTMYEHVLFVKPSMFLAPKSCSVCELNDSELKQ